MKRPGYREAVDWIACNDDCYWLADDEPMISVATALVRDLWDVTDEKIFGDLRVALRRVYPNHEAIR